MVFLLALLEDGHDSFLFQSSKGSPNFHNISSVPFVSISVNILRSDLHFPWSFAADVAMGERFLLAIPSLASFSSTWALAFLAPAVWARFL